MFSEAHETSSFKSLPWRLFAMKYRGLCEICRCALPEGSQAFYHCDENRLPKWYFICTECEENDFQPVAPLKYMGGNGSLFSEKYDTRMFRNKVYHQFCDDCGRFLRVGECVRGQYQVNEWIIGCFPSCKRKIPSCSVNFEEEFDTCDHLHHCQDIPYDFDHLPFSDKFETFIFRSRFNSSHCHSCDCLITRGQWIQGQKQVFSCGSHWSVKCYPHCKYTSYTGNYNDDDYVQIGIVYAVHEHESTLNYSAASSPAASSESTFSLIPSPGFEVVSLRKKLFNEHYEPISSRTRSKTMIKKRNAEEADLNNEKKEISINFER